MYVCLSAFVAMWYTFVVNVSICVVCVHVSALLHVSNNFKCIYVGQNK